MSICQCDVCSGYIDSDDDPDCFVDDLTGHGRDRIICESCREREGQEQERYESMQSKHESQGGI